MKFKMLISLVTLVALIYAEEVKTERYDIPYKGETELKVEVDFGMGEIDIRGGDTQTYIMRSGITYSNDYFKPIIDYQNVSGKGKLRLYTENFDENINLKKAKDMKETENHWRLEFIPDVPTSFDMDLGMGEGDLDFTNLSVTDLALSCGMSDVTFRFAEPNPVEMRKLKVELGLGSVDGYGLGNANISRFDVECGLGSAKLVFDGQFTQDMKGTITIGLGSVDIKFPKNVGVEVETESSFLSTVDLDNFDEISEDLYRSENWNDTKYKVYLRVEVGLGSVDVDWIND